MLAASLVLLLPLSNCASNGSEETEEELEVSEEDDADMEEASEDMEEDTDFEEVVDTGTDESEMMEEPATDESSLTDAIQALEDLDDSAEEAPEASPVDTAGDMAAAEPAAPAPNLGDATEPTAEIPSQPAPAADGVTVKSYALAVRDAPNGNVLRYIGHGETVTVMSQSGGWSQIGAGEFVRTGFLKSPTDGPVGDGQQAFQVNAKALYIRSQPASEAPVVGVLLEGETVKVVANDANGWSDLGGGRYIRTMFISESAGSAH